MKDESKTTLTLFGLLAAFLILGVLFMLDPWGKPQPIPNIPLVDPSFTDPSTVRSSVGTLMRKGADTSSFDCNACHEIGKPGKLEIDAQGQVIVPAGHTDLEMRHGRNHRNDHCYNCHDANNHALLKLRDGRKIKLEESTSLCADCHGPTYRDWEIGIHGRVSGYWDKKQGPATRQDCTDCHNPHSPAFQQVKPAPKPNPLHPEPHPVEHKKGE